MYIPAHFAETNEATLHDFIERHSFALLVSQLDGQAFASHLPFLLDRQAGPAGTLIGHMARANPQWQQAAGQNVLVVFSGPHAYISPSWYEAEQVVPTWNYAAVHVYGRLEITEAPADLLRIVRATVHHFEQGLPRPWQLEGSSTFIERLLSQIVGFRIEAERIEGKWKLNQNHPPDRRQNVIRALQQRDDANAQAIAALMQATLPPKEGLA